MYVCVCDIELIVLFVHTGTPGATDVPKYASKRHSG